MDEIRTKPADQEISLNTAQMSLEDCAHLYIALLRMGRYVEAQRVSYYAEGHAVAFCGPVYGPKVWLGEVDDANKMHAKDGPNA